MEFESYCGVHILVSPIPVHRVNFIVRSMLQNYMTALLEMLEIVLLLSWHVEYSVRSSCLLATLCRLRDCSKDSLVPRPRVEAGYEYSKECIVHVTLIKHNPTTP